VQLDGPDLGHEDLIGLPLCMERSEPVTYHDQNQQAKMAHHALKIRKMAGAGMNLGRAPYL
jgi:hypothetical protein